MTGDIIKFHKSVENPFFMESIEDGTDISKLEYHGNGEDVYIDGRQVMSRSCHDVLISYPNQENERGLLLVRRKAEPAKGYLWPLGGFYGRGVPTAKSLTLRIKDEGGLEIDEDSLLVLGHSRAMWKITSNKNAETKGLPTGIDDACVLWYAYGKGKLSLDKLHESPLIVTPKMYTSTFRKSLHPYVQMGIDRVIKLI